MLTLYDGVVSWKSSKQQIVADSVTEVEYIAASEAAKEVVWMKKFISELGVVPKIKQPVPLYYNNTEVVTQVEELSLIINSSIS